MNTSSEETLWLDDPPVLDDATLILAFDGWMDGGEVSTGTVSRLVDLLEAQPVAEIDPDPFYVYSFPGSMEIAALFRPHIEVEGGLIQSIEFPSNQFYCHPEARLFLFVGKEPHLKWRTLAENIFGFATRTGVRRILFVGSFGGTVPHTREPRMFTTCSDSALIRDMERYSVRMSGYSGPGSFASFLMTRAPDAGLDMVSLIAEIPSYLQGPNPASIEAVTRRLAKILKLPLELDRLRTASTEWELEVSRVVEENEELAEKVRELEEEYDNELLRLDSTEERG